MKKILILFLFISIRQSIGQTYVLIPDPNFAANLNGIVPGAMSGNSLNITSTLVTTATQTILVSFQNISNLEGIQYFTSLKFLNCGGNTYTTLPTLPNSLEGLYCGANGSFTSLPNIPSSLIDLNCISANLTSLPPLSAPLQTIICSGNLLNSLPALPNTLKRLDCQTNSLTALPALPTSLEYLYCADNLLVNLPSLPNSLLVLHCPNNLLTNLPGLPTSLSDLTCYSNSLTAIPSLPNSLRGLGCSNNSIVNLPALPDSLIALLCDHNLLTSLPSFPNTLNMLWAYNNDIKCFPKFPNGISYLNINNNPFNCLPNYIPVMSTTLMAVPLCAQGNSNGCAPVGLNEVNAAGFYFEIYPNPSTGKFYITSNDPEKKQLHLYDLTGKLILSNSINNNTEIDITNLNSGIYYLSVKTLNSTANKKLVIVH